MSSFTNYLHRQVQMRTGLPVRTDRSGGVTARGHTVRRPCTPARLIARELRQRVSRGGC